MTGGLPLLRLGAALGRRPWLWPAAARLVPSRWWRSPPFLPLPPQAYLRFRLETMYGSDGEPKVEDVIEYLEWCRRAPGRAR